MHYIRVACVRTLEAFTSYIRNIAFTFLATLISLCAIEANAQIRSYYDEVGRQIEVVAPDGQSTQYTYGALGNILGIKQLAASAVSISGFTPNGGPVGTTVTVHASGYSGNSVNNTIRFDGTAAAVSAAAVTRYHSGSQVNIVTISGTARSEMFAHTAGAWVVKTISRIALVAGTNTVSITKDRGGIAIAA